MSQKKLSKQKTEVWDRLKNGLQPDKSFKDLFSEELAASMAKKLAEEIDKEILGEIIKIANDGNDKL